MPMLQAEATSDINHMSWVYCKGKRNGTLVEKTMLRHIVTPSDARTGHVLMGSGEQLAVEKRPTDAPFFRGETKVRRDTRDHSPLKPQRSRLTIKETSHEAPTGRTAARKLVAPVTDFPPIDAQIYDHPTRCNAREPHSKLGVPPSKRPKLNERTQSKYAVLSKLTAEWRHTSPLSYCGESLRDFFQSCDAVHRQAGISAPCRFVEHSSHNEDSVMIHCWEGLLEVPGAEVRTLEDSVEFLTAPLDGLSDKDVSSDSDYDTAPAQLNIADVVLWDPGSTTSSSDLSPHEFLGNCDAALWLNERWFPCSLVAGSKDTPEHKQSASENELIDVLLFDGMCSVDSERVVAVAHVAKQFKVYTVGHRQEDETQREKAADRLMHECEPHGAIFALSPCCYTACPDGPGSEQAMLHAMRAGHSLVEMLAGCGQFSRAMQCYGIMPKGFCELDPCCVPLLQTLAPDAELAADFYDCDWKLWGCANIRVLTAGPACQPYSLAGKKLGAKDSRSNQMADMAKAAAWFNPDIVILENVSDIMDHPEVLKQVVTAFKDAGYTMHKPIFDFKHYELGGATKRRRVFFYFEKHHLAASLPPLKLDLAEPMPPGKAIDYLVPREEVPVDCILKGNIVWTPRPSAEPPIIGHIHHGGEHSKLMHGSLVEVHDQWGRWRVMAMETQTRHGPRIELMLSTRHKPRRIYVKPDQISKILKEKTAVYSIHGITKSVRGFGEWPTRTVNLIWDDRGDDEGVVRPILPREAWALQELCPKQYEACLQAGLSVHEIYKIAGNSIPTSMLTPLAALTSQRLAMIDVMWNTPVHRSAMGTKAAPTVEALGNTGVSSTALWVPTHRTAVDKTSKQDDHTVIVHVAIIDMDTEDAQVLVTPDGRLPTLQHGKQERSWSVSQAVKSCLAPGSSVTDDMVLALAAEYSPAAKVTHRVVVAARPPSASRNTTGRWQPGAQVASSEALFVGAALSTLTSLRPTDAAHNQYAHTAFMKGAGVLEARRLHPKLLGANSAGPAWDQLQRCSAQQEHELKEALLAEAGDDPVSTRVRSWADSVGLTTTDPVPAAMQSTLHQFDDPTLQLMRFSHTCVPPVTTIFPVPPPQQQVKDFHPRTMRHLLYDEALDVLIPQWVRLQLEDIWRYKKYGPDAVRQHNTTMALGQDWVRPEARGIEWDLRRLGDEVITPLSWATPPKTHLNRPNLQHDLRGYPDQEMTGFLMTGVQFKTDDMQLQIVFCPHLMSLSHGVESVEKELKKLAARDWYGLFSHMPFLPLRCQSQGSVPRKLEPDRWRRIIEAGAPRNPEFDTEEMLVVPLNQAIKGYKSIKKANFEADPKAYYDSVKPEDILKRWPKELKSSVTAQVRDLAILKHAAYMAGEPIFVFSDDAESWFHQFALLQKEYPKVCVIYDPLEPEHDFCTWAVEYVMAMGITMASQLSQRAGHGLIWMVAQEMDALEAAIEEPSPVLRKWLLDRAQLDKGRSDDGSLWREARLWTAHSFTDDFLFAAVTIVRFVRLMRCWCKVIVRGGWLFGGPLKRQIGLRVRSLGADLHLDAGVVVIPADKTARALAGLQRVLSRTEHFGDYQSLLGLLEHLRVISSSDKTTMYGMYGPMNSAWLPGPSDPVFISPRMEAAALEWRTLLRTVSGCNFLDTLQSAAAQLTTSNTQFHLYSDAALEGAVIPSLGGWFHGQWWAYPLAPCMYDVPISWWEFAAAAVNLIMFHHYVWGSSGSYSVAVGDTEVVLHVDGLATPLILQRSSAKSIGLQYIHLKLKDTAAFEELAPVLAAAHCRGERNVASDFASRGMYSELAKFSATLGVTPVRLDVTPAATLFVKEIYAKFKLWQAEQDSLKQHDDGSDSLPPPRPTPNTQPRDQDGKGYPNNMIGDGPDFQGGSSHPFPSGWQQDRHSQPPLEYISQLSLSEDPGAEEVQHWQGLATWEAIHQTEALADLAAPMTPNDTLPEDAVVVVAQTRVIPMQSVIRPIIPRETVNHTVAPPDMHGRFTVLLAECESSFAATPRRVYDIRVHGTDSLSSALERATPLPPRQHLSYADTDRWHLLIGHQQALGTETGEQGGAPDFQTGRTSFPDFLLLHGRPTRRGLALNPFTNPQDILQFAMRSECMAVYMHERVLEVRVVPAPDALTTATLLPLLQFSWTAQLDVPAAAPGQVPEHQKYQHSMVWKYSLNGLVHLQHDTNWHRCDPADRLWEGWYRGFSVRLRKWYRYHPFSTGENLVWEGDSYDANLVHTKLFRRWTVRYDFLAQTWGLVCTGARRSERPLGLRQAFQPLTLEDAYNTVKVSVPEYSDILAIPELCFTGQFKFCVHRDAQGRRRLRSECVLCIGTHSWLCPMCATGARTHMHFMCELVRRRHECAIGTLWSDLDANIVRAQHAYRVVITGSELWSPSPDPRDHDIVGVPQSSWHQCHPTVMELYRTISLLEHSEDAAGLLAAVTLLGPSSATLSATHLQQIHDDVAGVAVAMQAIHDDAQTDLEVIETTEMYMAENLRALMKRLKLAEAQEKAAEDYHSFRQDFPNLVSCEAAAHYFILRPSYQHATHPGPLMRAEGHLWDAWFHQSVMSRSLFRLVVNVRREFPTGPADTYEYVAVNQFLYGHEILADVLSQTCAGTWKNELLYTPGGCRSYTFHLAGIESNIISSIDDGFMQCHAGHPCFFRNTKLVYVRYSDVPGETTQRSHFSYESILRDGQLTTVLGTISVVATCHSRNGHERTCSRRNAAQQREDSDPEDDDDSDGDPPSSGPSSGRSRAHKRARSPDSRAPSCERPGPSRQQALHKQAGGDLAMALATTVADPTSHPWEKIMVPHQDFDGTLGFQGEGPVSFNRKPTPQGTTSPVRVGVAFNRKTQRDTVFSSPGSSGTSFTLQPSSHAKPTAAKRPMMLPSQSQVDTRSLVARLQSDTSEFALNPQSWSQVSQWCALSQAFQQRAANPSTLYSDNASWRRYWVPFCISLRTPILRKIRGAMTILHPDWDRECNLWVWFLLHVYERIRPRSKTDPEAKPASVLAVLLAARREHKRNGLQQCLPSLTAITSTVKGMTMMFIDRHGHEALLPHRKEPITTAVISHLMTLPEGTQISPTRHVARSSFLGRSFSVAVGVAKDTGARKDELMNTLTRASIVWFVGDGQVPTEITEPTPAQVDMMFATKATVLMATAPGPAKNDWDGQRYGNFMAYIALQHDESNTAYQVLCMERDFPVPDRFRRRRTPLVGPALGEAFSRAQMDSLLAGALQAVAQGHPDVLSPARVQRYSWHSFRISLACRLKALDYDDSTIMEACRWASTHSLRLYARISKREYAAMVHKASNVQIDSVQAATLWQNSPPIDDDHRFGFAERLAQHIASENAEAE